jgi:shikimate dehydrogenase
VLEGVRHLGFAGINVTFPYKEAVVELLDELSPSAALIGAVNTIVVRDGRLFPGFAKSPLYEDTDTLAVRAGHPRKRLLSTVKGFQAHQHVSVVGAGEARDELDEWLDKVGLQRLRCAMPQPRTSSPSSLGDSQPRGRSR